MSDLETFRLETKGWLANNCPEDMRHPYSNEADICWGGRAWEYSSSGQEQWLNAMAAKGWTTPTWPKEYGGGGLSGPEAKILREEMAAINARSPLESFGISMLGPALMKFGSTEQKQEHLPKIVRGEIRWCQGYSEPNAGSDLAGLMTKCEDKGDHFLVNGQKIWTSYADKADWIFCLVRTNPDDKHKGISFLLFDMASEGVSTKPILLISGNSPFCETFFDDVKVPKDGLMGELNKGWTIAKYLLTHEREMIGGSGLSNSGEDQVLKDAIAQVGLDGAGHLDDPILRAELAKLQMDAMAFAFTMERATDEAKAGASMGAASSMLKYYGTELNKRKYETQMSLGGYDALEWDSERSINGQLARSWLRTKANSIEGGTSEIQLNIIAKHILRLPS